MFGRRRQQDPGSKPDHGTGANPYQGLRQQILQATPQLAGITAAPSATVVYGALLDWGLDRAVATVVALADGTASLYLSGGGVIGGGFHEPVRQASRAFIASLEPHLGLMSADEAGDLPEPGTSHLRALTTDGRLVVRAPTGEFGQGQHPMSFVFHAAQVVIATLRQVAQASAP